MAALPVSSFPGSFAQPQETPAPVITPSKHCWPGRSGTRSTSYLALDLASFSRLTATTRVNHDKEIPEPPYSPILFRPIQQHVNIQHHVRVASPSPSSQDTPWHSVRHPISTKESIANLGVSRHRPSPSYKILQQSHPVVTFGKRTLRETTYPTPRSSSLDTFTQHSQEMIRKLSSSSSLVDFDHFSEEIAFAERSPDEPEFGSAKKLPPVPILSYPSPLRSQSPSSCVSTDTHNDISGPSLKAKLSSTSLRNKPAKTVPRPWDNPSADFQPYSLMGAGGNLRYKWYAPTAPDLVYDRRPKPKPKPVAKTPSPSPVMEKSSKLSLKRVRLLGYRRSLTSSDFTNLGALAGMSDSASSTTTLVSEGRKSNDYGSQERKSRDIPPEDKDESDSRITTHHVVGNVWEEKDMSDVIPALRLLRVAGNLKL